MTPLTKEEAATLLAALDAAKAKRAADMPTEQDAVKAMFDAWQRLKELGWSEAIYCPKDGTMFKAIEPGSTGFHDCIYRGEWPDGSWWVVERCDMMPSHPCLWKPL
jgi:hypothetical protein